MQSGRFVVSHHAPLHIPRLTTGHSLHGPSHPDPHTADDLHPNTQHTDS